MFNKKYDISAFVFIGLLFTIMTNLLIAGSLTDGDWLVDVDEDSANITAWENADKGFLFEHGFWYRTDNTSEELPFNNSSEFSLTNSSSSTNSTSLDYEGDQFNVNVKYELNEGSQPEESSIQQKITFTNTTGNTLNLHWFEYSDLDINPFDADMASGDLVTITQFADPSLLFGETPIFIRDTIDDTLPEFFAIAEVDNFDDILDQLTDSSPTTLSFTEFNEDFALDSVGDLAYARQWNLAVPAFESKMITSGKISSLNDTISAPIPEPGTMMLVLIGIVSIGYFKAKKIHPGV